MKNPYVTSAIVMALFSLTCGMYAVAGIPCPNPLTPTCLPYAPVCITLGQACAKSYYTTNGGCIQPPPGGTGSDHECTPYNLTVSCPMTTCIETTPGNIDTLYCDPAKPTGVSLPAGVTNQIPCKYEGNGQ